MIDAATADGSWTLLEDVEDLVVPPDLAAALAAAPPAREHVDAFPRSARRAVLRWLVTARRPVTRAGRIATTVEKPARGERAQG